MPWGALLRAEITCRQCLAQEYPYLCFLSEDLWGWELHLAWVTSSSGNSCYWLPSSSRNVYEDFTRSSDFHHSLYFPSQIFLFPWFSWVFASLEAYVFGMQHTARPWHFFTTPAHPLLAILGQNCPPETWNRKLRDRNNLKEPRDRWAPPEWRRYLHGMLASVIGQEW